MYLLMGDKMKKKVLVSGIMAAFVSAALSGCQVEDEVMTYSGMGGDLEKTYTVSNTKECIAFAVGDEEQCKAAFDTAQKKHEEVSPKYSSQEKCEEGTDVKCTVTTVQNTDGSSSSVFVPAMMGMIVGSMLNNNSNAMPVYNDREGRAVTSAGAYVPSKGAGLVGSKTFSASRTQFYKPNASTIPSMKSGGFGKSGSFGSTTG